MTQLELIKQLVQRLKKEEIKSLKRFLKMFEENPEQSKLKSVQLLDLLLEEDVDSPLDDTQLCKDIYGQSDERTLRTFQKLLLRFKDKVYENLLLDINIYRKESFDERSIAVSEVRKQLLLINILRFKSSDDEIERLLDKVISKAKMFELYLELIQALELKLNFLGYRIGFNDVSFIRKDIEFYERCRKSLSEAVEWYNRLGESNSDNDEISYDRYLEQVVEKLEHEYRFTQSLNIAYYMYLVSLELYQRKGDLENGEEACYKLVELLKTNRSVYLDNRMGTALINLANNNVLRFHFDEAIINANEAKKYFPSNGINANICDELICYAHFYKGDLDLAEEKVTSLLANEHAVQTNFQVAKRKFILANIYFLKEEFSKASKLIQELKDLEKSRVEWNTGMRILSIIIQLKQEKFDLFDSQLENLRKYIERVSKSTFVHQRFIVILKLLLDLGRNSFDYTLVWAKDRAQFEQLYSDKIKLRWQPTSPEMIIFNAWFVAQMNGGYKPDCRTYKAELPDLNRNSGKLKV